MYVRLCMYVWSNHFCEGFVLNRRHADIATNLLWCLKEKKKNYKSALTEQTSLIYISLQYMFIANYVWLQKLLSSVYFFVTCLDIHIAYYYIIKLRREKKKKTFCMNMPSHIPKLYLMKSSLRGYCVLQLWGGKVCVLRVNEEEFSINALKYKSCCVCLTSTSG